MISGGNILRVLGTEPPAQYETSINVKLERHLAVNFTMGSQLPAMGLH